MNTGPQVHKILVSKTNATKMEVDKNYLLSLIEKLGKDNLVQPGEFPFYYKVWCCESFCLSS